MRLSNRLGAKSGKDLPRAATLHSVRPVWCSGGISASAGTNATVGHDKATVTYSLCIAVHKLAMAKGVLASRIEHFRKAPPAPKEQR